MTIMYPSPHGPPPHGPPPHAHGFPPPPARPPQLVLAAIAVAGCVAVVFGLTVVVVSYAVSFEFQLMAQLPLAVLVPALIWLPFLVPALLRGRPWARLATAVTVPIQIPLYGLYLWILLPVVTDPDLADSPKAGLRVTAMVLCMVGILLAAVAPTFLVGDGVRAYLRARR